MARAKGSSARQINLLLGRRRRASMAARISRSALAPRRGRAGNRALHRGQSGACGIGRNVQALSLVGCGMAMSRTFAAEAAPTTAHGGSVRSRQQTICRSAFRRDRSIANDRSDATPIRRMPASFSAMHPRLTCAHPNGTPHGVASIGRPHGQHPLSRPPPAVSAQQGRQGALVPPASAPGGEAPGVPRHVHRRSRRRRARRRGESGCAPTSTSSRCNPRLARVRSLAGLLNGEALTLPYYRSANLAAWVARTAREQKLDAAVVFSSAMAQYVPAELGLRMLVDLVDVDSAKWTQYAGNHRWPLSWLYRPGRAQAARVRARDGTPGGAFVPGHRRRGRALRRTGAGMRWPGGCRRQWRGLRFLFARARLCVALRRRQKFPSCSPARWTTGRTSTR